MVTRALGGVLVLGALALVLLWPRQPAPPDLTGQVRKVCAAYADLDLSELAPLCVQVGYQQHELVRVMPEDLDR